MDLYGVYKIIREDGKIYIGMTKENRIKVRMREHSITNKLKGYKFSYEILYNNLSYHDACELEAKKIKECDSYTKGLNATVNGKGNHNCPTFTTFGYKFSKESKEKMSRSQKARVGRRVGFTHSEETKKLISKKLKGRRLTCILTEEKVKEVRILYASKPEIEGVGKVQRNGLLMSYDQAFAKKYAKSYNLSITGLRKIITRETWKNV